LVEVLVTNDFEVTFLSTCQGINGYVDDSATANRTCGMLEEKFRAHVEVDNSYYDLPSLRDRLCDFEMVIGTRLHMCILGLLSGVPSFNISYEFKGKELYDYLGWKEWSIDYNEDPDTGVSRLKKFIEKRQELQSGIDAVVRQQNESALKSFSEVLSRV
jgi:polysaccharide pyruvyl transferase WcaK-like protein